MSEMRNDPDANTTGSIAKKRTPSYARICVAARNPPSAEYLLFEAHVAARIKTGFNAISANTIKRSYGEEINENFPHGRKARMKNGKSVMRTGEATKRTLSAYFGMTMSFCMNLTASAAVCRVPNGPTVFGPYRECILPMNLRSKSPMYSANPVTNSVRRIEPLIMIRYVADIT